MACQTVMAKFAPNAPCPCGVGPKYKKCCRPIHLGRPADRPEQLMRSRYTAYAIGLADFIIETTDPKGDQWEHDRENWLDDIRVFSQTTRFQELTILETEMVSENEGFVAFRARLEQAGADASFAERSRFVKGESGWLYVDGKPLDL